MKILRHKLLAGNSDRSGHLKLNAIASFLLLGWSLKSASDGEYLAATSWFTIATSCLLTEVFIAPDVDCAERWSGSELYHYWWKAFGAKVPHRSVWSHSLLLGLPLRIMWGILPIALLMSGLAMATLLVLESRNVDASLVVGILERALNQALAIDLFKNLAIGAIISDCVHYTLDDYNPVEWVFGDRAIQKFFKYIQKSKRKRNARTRKSVAAQKTRSRRRAVSPIPPRSHYAPVSRSKRPRGAKR